MMKKILLLVLTATMALAALTGCAGKESGTVSTDGSTSIIHYMAVATIKMVTDSIDAFVKSDVEFAKSVIVYDDVVDGHFDREKEQLIRYLGKPEADGEYAFDLLMIAKYFERIGDHATNIAEWVLFSILGHHPNSI